MLYPLDEVWTAQELAAIVGGRVQGDGARGVSVVAIDSREQSPDGGLFAAIAGERVDGHSFLEGAAANGFRCMRVREGTALPDGVTGILCGDTLRALGDFASAIRKRYAPRLVGVTGSVGKTTTKQMIGSVLSERFFTHMTDGNFNNQIGVPLTLLGLKRAHRAAVVEMGMSAKGEIARLSEIARPDIGVITNIGSSHIEYLGSREGIRDAKMEIVTGMPAGAPLLLNGDEPLLAGIPGASYISFENPDAEIAIGAFRSDANGAVFDTEVFGRRMQALRIPAAGRHNVYNAAAAAGVGLLMGVSEEEIRAGLEAFVNTGMRQRIRRIGAYTFIEDCYNAGPESMQSALRVLRDLSARGGGIAVLGDMKELGSYSAALHRQVGEAAAEAGLRALITFGEEAAAIADGAVGAGMRAHDVFTVTDASHPEQAAALLCGLLRPGDTALFKASRAMALERVIEAAEEKIRERN